jgi:DNA replication protein DnaC
MKPIFNTVQALMTLGLHGMAVAYERQLESPALLKETFDARLGLMVDAENSERESRKIARLLKGARLRENEATVDSIEFKASRGIDRNTFMTLGECDWLARRQNVIITGATGTGKTWLACALGNQACRLGRLTLYRTATKLFEEISLSYADHTMPKLRRQLIRAELLIIDDLGIGGIDAQLGPFLLDVIDQQSQNGSLLITSQYPKEKWYDLFSDPTIADAILDRIVHKSHVIELKGESMRRIKSRRRT